MKTEKLSLVYSFSEGTLSWIDSYYFQKQAIIYDLNY